jgi:hypothetical protein
VAVLMYEGRVVPEYEGVLVHPRAGRDGRPVDAAAGAAGTVPSGLILTVHQQILAPYNASIT